MAPPEMLDMSMFVGELEDVGGDVSSGVAADEILAILLAEDRLAEAVGRAIWRTSTTRYDAAEGWAELRILKVSLKRVALRDATGLLNILQKTLIWPVCLLRCRIRGANQS
jgi:hypothetical protein